MLALIIIKKLYLISLFPICLKQLRLVLKVFLVFSFICCFQHQSLATITGITSELQTNVIGHYLFNNNLTDLSSNSYDGTGYGTLVSANDRFGNSNSAYEFSGDDYIYFGDNMLDSFSSEQFDFSISIWAKSSSTAQRAILAFGNSDGLYTGMITRFFSNKISFNASNRGFNTSTSKPSDGNWHHYVFVYDVVNSNTKIRRVYIDGSLAGTKNEHPCFRIRDNGLSIGRERFSDSDSNRYIGTVDDVTLFNKALSASEISALYSYQDDASNMSNNETVTFSHTGAEQTFTVPGGVTSLIVNAYGGSGGRGASVNEGIGGLGGQVQATIQVTAGETLYIYVGGRGRITGSSGGSYWTKENSAGGFNGGGAGGSIQGGGGGGATDIRRGGNNLSNRIIVAGAGGGGGGQRRSSNPGGDGGDGGGLTGESGDAGNYGSGGAGGPGGTQSAGGAAQTNSEAGSLGQGGYGANPGTNASQRDAGGGGAGYFGGAGGGSSNDKGGGGGGGGSSFAISTATNVVHTQGVHTGDGSLTITYEAPLNSPPTVSNVSASGDENIALSITLSGSDSDGNSLTYSIVSNPANGSVSISGAVATYTPNANFVGSNSFTYKANDGTVDSDSNATVSITINEADLDNDGINDSTDTDDDGDGVADSSDAFPRDSTETLDTDGDNTGNNADTDDDGDGVADSSDAFPLDSGETLDTDGDGIGNNTDADDDGDGVADTFDENPLDSSDTTYFLNANTTLSSASDIAGMGADGFKVADGITVTVQADLTLPAVNIGSSAELVLSSGTITSETISGSGQLTISNATVITNQINTSTTQTGGILKTNSNLTLPSNFTQTGGSIDLNIASDSSINKIILQGDIQVNGTLNLTRNSDYTPVPGTNFEMIQLDGHTISGSPVINMPSVPDAYTWNANPLLINGESRMIFSGHPGMNF